MQLDNYSYNMSAEHKAKISKANRLAWAKKKELGLKKTDHLSDYDKRGYSLEKSLRDMYELGKKHGRTELFYEIQLLTYRVDS